MPTPKRPTKKKSRNKEHIFISTSIPYPNDEPHLGFGLEITEADALARYYRSLGHNVFFLTGTDENSLKNVLAAEKRGVSVKEWVAKISLSFRGLKKLLNLSFDDFIRTTEPRHVKGSQKLWLACRKDIYKKQYQGLYCVGCETFYLKKDLVNGLCPEHKTKPEAVKEENYFFRLEKYAAWLLKLIQSRRLEVVPASRRNEVLSFIREGLADFSVSRSSKRAKGWGIPVPDDKSQVMWVWFDALANYISALGYAENSSQFSKFWQKNKNIIHLIGKGVSRFHAVYWPAMLKSAGLNLPTKILAHGYVTVNGEKMSKSLGNFLTVKEVVGKFGAEAVRYYLLRGITSWEDGDFSDERFKARYNGDLANGLGNFASRVLTLGSKLGKIRNNYAEDVEKKTEKAVQKARQAVAEKISEFKLNEAVAAVWELISFGDEYVNKTEPWKLKTKESQIKPIFNLIVVLDNVAALLQPFMPETAKKITASINWLDSRTLRVKKIPPLFPRLN